MLNAEANVQAILEGEEVGGQPAFKQQECFNMTTESLAKEYPLYIYSLTKLIENSEDRIEKAD
ncbi:transcriptional regulator [gut metagenome]|uniref:Transcriptional regulator n=1 Tax=gut metagenome TaxID=749906 RepID=J9GAZ7_9ZZZZ